MATATYRQARFIGRAELSGCRRPFGGYGLTGFKESATQSWVAGEPIRPDDTTGKFVVTPDGDSLASLYGMAEEAASGVTDNPVYGWLFTAGDRFVMNLETGGTAVATSLGQVGDPVNFNKVSHNLVADIADPGGTPGFKTTLPSGRIVGIYCVEHGYLDGDALGDTGGRVIVEITASPYLGRSA